MIGTTCFSSEEDLVAPVPGAAPEAAAAVVVVEERGSVGVGGGAVAVSRNSRLPRKSNDGIRMRKLSA